MKVCQQCFKENPDDFKHCRYCGALMLESPFKTTIKIWKKLPAWAWILIIVAGLAAFIVAIIGSFIAVSTIEGIASLILLTLGMIGFGIIPLRKPENTPPFARAIGLSFFALMGASVDQTGNYLYNKPVEICFCAEGSSLERAENVSHPVPGSTYINQDFTCYNKAGVPVKQINIFAVLGIRFIEYVIIGYILIGVRRFLWSLKIKKDKTSFL